MRKISKVATGTPLRNTSPAAIEDFLVTRIRADLGELKEVVSIRPILRIDSEDGDLSGNVENGYGTIALTVGEKTLQVPFIISEKELLPFDSIRMGEDMVTYDMSKLRKLVIGLDNHHKGQSDSSDNEVMQVTDIKDVPTHNGFLGTILSIRDDQRNRDVNGQQPYEGMNFGDMNADRLSKRASANVDVLEVFEEFHEKLASVRVYSEEDVQQVVEKMSKQAETESQKAIDSVKEISLETKDALGVQREMAKVDNTKLADAKRAASGNNVRFPIFDENRFEFRNGRVYSTFENLGSSTSATNIKRIVLDANGNYSFLRDGEKFMVDTQPPKTEFDLSKEKGRGLEVGGMYTVERGTSSIASPFVIQKSFREQYMDNGMLVSVRERMDRNGENPVNPLGNSLFRDLLSCSNVLSNWSNDFKIIILKNSDQELTVIDTEKELPGYMAEHAENPSDIANAKFMVDYIHGEKAYLIGENADLVKMKKKISGHFKRPDGLFKEGPMFHKQASSDDMNNKARLIINEQKKPATYSVAWAFKDEEDVEGNKSFSLQKRELKDLAPAQAKKVLGDLGYDSRKQQLFFEIAKRNGRYAEFGLPDAKKAANVSPQDAKTNKAKTAVTNIANSTLNAKNFVPVMNEISRDGLAGALTGTKAHDFAQRFNKNAHESLRVATEFEKTAETIRGNEWTEIAYLLNMKHHMDKLACQISEGYAHGANEVLEKIASLQPEIEKKAYSLLRFNQEQLLQVQKPLVDPMLIKEALAQFDEMSAYVEAKHRMEKNASFFRKGVPEHIQRLKLHGDKLSTSADELLDTYRELVVDLRTLEQKGMKDSPEYAELSAKAKEVAGEMSMNGFQMGQTTGILANNEARKAEQKTMLGAAVGFPGIAGLSYGYQGFKNE